MEAPLRSLLYIWGLPSLSLSCLSPSHSEFSLFLHYFEISLGGFHDATTKEHQIWHCACHSHGERCVLCSLSGSCTLFHTHTPTQTLTPTRTHTPTQTHTHSLTHTHWNPFLSICYLTSCVLSLMLLASFHSSRHLTHTRALSFIFVPRCEM